MRIKIFLFIPILFTRILCSAQPNLPNGATLTKEVTSYILEDKEITTLVYKLNNKSKEVLWLWINRNDETRLSNIEKFKKYFYYKDNPNDMNLLQIGMDGGVETFIPVVYKTFIKRISPENEFSIQVIANGKISDSILQSVFLFIDERIVVLTEGEISKFRNGITDMSQIIFYKPETIILYKEGLRF
jgi:hypothetical protein